MPSYFFNAPPSRPPMRELPCEAPQLGRNYRVFDGVLADPMAVRQRLFRHGAGR